MNNSKTISISQLISLLNDPNTYGGYIAHINFIGLNDTFNQYINELGTDETLYPPEWLNLDANELNNENISFTSIDNLS